MRPLALKQYGRSLEKSISDLSALKGSGNSGKVGGGALRRAYLPQLEEREAAILRFLAKMTNLRNVGSLFFVNPVKSFEKGEIANRRSSSSRKTAIY
ncbi:hypothetical protein ASG93_10540 [Paenibacillus sp. Soil787]|nr:hypothetical protein ASG93_10540 [Paenibacillus sp. Soil787]